MYNFLQKTLLGRILKVSINIAENIVEKDKKTLFYLSIVITSVLKSSRLQTIFDVSISLFYYIT